MLTEAVVVDASPLITLCKCDEEEILHSLFTEIVVPRAVFDEVLTGGSQDQAARKLPLLS